MALITFLPLPAPVVPGSLSPQEQTSKDAPAGVPPKNEFIKAPPTAASAISIPVASSHWTHPSAAFSKSDGPQAFAGPGDAPTATATPVVWRELTKDDILQFVGAHHRRFFIVLDAEGGYHFRDFPEGHGDSLKVVQTGEKYVGVGDFRFVVRLFNRLVRRRIPRMQVGERWLLVESEKPLVAKLFLQFMEGTLQQVAPKAPRAPSRKQGEVVQVTALDQLEAFPATATKWFAVVELPGGERVIRAKASTRGKLAQEGEKMVGAGTFRLLKRKHAMAEGAPHIVLTDGRVLVFNFGFSGYKLKNEKLVWPGPPPPSFPIAENAGLVSTLEAFKRVLLVSVSAAAVAPPPAPVQPTGAPVGESMNVHLADGAAGTSAIQPRVEPTLETGGGNTNGKPVNMLAHSAGVLVGGSALLAPVSSQMTRGHLNVGQYAVLVQAQPQKQVVAEEPPWYSNFEMTLQKLNEALAYLSRADWKSQNGLRLQLLEYGNTVLAQHNRSALIQIQLALQERGLNFDSLGFARALCLVSNNYDVPMEIIGAKSVLSRGGFWAPVPTTLSPGRVVPIQAPVVTPYK